VIRLTATTRFASKCHCAHDGAKRTHAHTMAQSARASRERSRD
jgi:hypothetical protein